MEIKTPENAYTRYTTRAGQKARVYDKEVERDGFIKVIGAILRSSGWSYSNWNVNGRWLDNGPDNDYDLVSEGWPPETPQYDRSWLPIWANKAIAMNPDESWFCFSHLPERCDDEWIFVEGVAVKISHEFRPVWEGDWKDSLLVFEGEEEGVGY